MLACSGLVALAAGTAQAAPSTIACSVAPLDRSTRSTECPRQSSLARLDLAVAPFVLIRMPDGGSSATARGDATFKLQGARDADPPAATGTLAALAPRGGPLPSFAEPWVFGAPSLGRHPADVRADWLDGLGPRLEQADGEDEDERPDTGAFASGLVEIIRNGGRLDARLGAGELDLDLLDGEFAYSIQF